MNEKQDMPQIVPLQRARRDAAADEWKRSEMLRGIGRSGTCGSLGKGEDEVMIEEAPAYEVGEDKPNGAHGLRKTEMRGDGAATG
jgi:hypothetical protein